MIYFLIALWIVSGIVSWQVMRYKRLHDTLNLLMREINLPEKVTQIKMKTLSQPVSEKFLVKELFQYVVKGPISLYHIYHKGSRGL